MNNQKLLKIVKCMRVSLMLVFIQFIFTSCGTKQVTESSIAPPAASATPVQPSVDFYQKGYDEAMTNNWSAASDDLSQSTDPRALYLLMIAEAHLLQFQGSFNLAYSVKTLPLPDECLKAVPQVALWDLSNFAGAQYYICEITKLSAPQNPYGGPVGDNCMPNTKDVGLISVINQQYGKFPGWLSDFGLSNSNLVSADPGSPPNLPFPPR
jgi:hypothetical protein